MLKRLCRKKGSSGLLSAGTRAWLVPIVLLAGMTQVQAQFKRCSRLHDLTPSTNWNMMSDGQVFKNGDVIGRMSAYAQYSMPLVKGSVDEVWVSEVKIHNNNYHAVPVRGVPGLGLVVRWAGYTATTRLEMPNPPVSAGTILSGQHWFNVLRAKTREDYTMTQNFTMELVIIDEKVYKGGTPIPEKYAIQVVIGNKQKGHEDLRVCTNGALNPMEALTGTLQVPKLPKPALPSCKFSTSTLTQRVTLGPVDPGQIVPVGTVRDAGGQGQAHFLIEGTGCTKDVKLNIYFTDARDSATPKDYLLTSNSAVGIRLFHRGEYDPVPFGPAPSGSWVPPHYAPSTGPAMADGAVLSTGFTAQYVRLPNKTEADVRPGPLEAAATFVIVYS